MSITIRKNNRRKIEEILKAAVLIREFRYDDMGDDSRAVQPADVLRAGFDDPQLGFERVYQEGDTARFVIHRNWSFTAYASIDAARRSLTPQAFAKYFPVTESSPAVRKYRVYLYPIVAVVVSNVEAESPEDARDKAEEIAGLHERFDVGGAANVPGTPDYDPTPGLIEYTQYCEQLDGAHVSELSEDPNDCDFVREFEYGADGLLIG